MPEPMTQEQIDYFAKECEDSFRRGSRWAAKRALVGYGILFAGVLAMYWNGQHVSGTERDAIVESASVAAVTNCNRDYNQIERLRGLLTRAQEQTTASARRGEIPQGQATHAKDFYSGELARLPLPDCRKVKVVLTSNPNKPIIAPHPLHPPDKT